MDELMDGVVGWIPSCCQATKYYEVVNVEVSRAFLQVAKQNPPMQVYVTVPTAPGFPNVPDRSLTGETRDLVCLYLGTNSKYSIVNCSCMSFPTWMQPTKNPRPFLPFYMSPCVVGTYVYVCMYK